MKKFYDGGEYFVLTSYRIKAVPISDDNAVSLTLAKTICEDACYLSSAGNGQTAIEILRNEPVSIFPYPLVRILKNRQLAIPLKIFPVQPFTPNQRHDDRIVKPGIFHLRLKVYHLVSHPLQNSLQSIGLKDATIIGV